MQATEVADVVLSRLQTRPSAMVLQKLLYYVQAWHLAVLDEPLFDDVIEAWKDGPVIDNVWRSRTDPQSRRVGLKASAPTMDPRTDLLIERVIEAYGSKSGIELSGLTHDESPWPTTRGDLPESARSRSAIAPALMRDYYRHEGLLGGQTSVQVANDLATLTADEDGELSLEEILAKYNDVDSLPDNGWADANLVVSDSEYDDLVHRNPRRSVRA